MTANYFDKKIARRSIMRHLRAQMLRIFLACTFVLVFGFTVTFGTPTSPEQARAVVGNWLMLDDSPLDTFVGMQIKDVEIFKDNSEKPLYYIVYLEPEGYVIVSADDLIEPIVGLVMHGDFDPSPENPLGALVSRDLPGRLAHVQKRISAAQIQGKEFAAQGLLKSAQSKWNFLLSINNVYLYEESGVSSISDVRVSPFVQSRWGQSYEGSSPCYNYYTEWSNVYYPSGCVATAMAQLMRYHSFPTAGVGTTAYEIAVAGTSRSENLRGGDGSGGPYNWSSMTLDPDASTDTTARRAIGALTHDAGVSVNMEYTTGSSASDTLDAADALIDAFYYNNALRGYNSANNIPGPKLNLMLNPNLDANFPVIIGITGPAGGHAVVIDGYGYNFSTLYHHLNMGWSGNDDAWYNLPDIDSDTPFTTVYKCVYNVYTSGTGEIISGRVLNLSGNPVAGATVTATRSGGGTYSALTNSKGIYALGRVLSSSTYTLNAVKSGYNFESESVSTGSSVNNSTTVGNLWEVNIHETTVQLPSKATNPIPGNGVSGISINVDLSWANGGGATSYDVYFGTDLTPDSGEFKGNQATTAYDPGALNYDTTYYWRIDAKNDDGTTAGDVWSFTTEEAPSIVTVSATDGTAAEPSDTGTFRISRTGSTAQNLTVYFSTSGTATNGTDYHTISSPKTIPAGSSYVSITLIPKDDSADEVNETAVLTISTNSAYQRGTPYSATITIHDNDAPEITKLRNGQVVPVTVDPFEEKFFVITVPSGRTILTAKLTAVYGDPDIYVRYGSPPTTTAYDCRPYSVDPEGEICTHLHPEAGDWYIMVRGFTVSSSELTARYEPAFQAMPWISLLLLDDSNVTPINPILAKTELLKGYWHFLYTISTSTFERYYSLDTIDGTQNSQGGYHIYGEDEYGDIVVASYWPDDQYWTLYDEAGSINRFYIFYTNGSQILANSCYYQINNSTGDWSSCYELSGEKIPPSAPSAGPMLLDDNKPEPTASEEMSRREEEKLAEMTAEPMSDDILEKYIEQRIAIELHY
jgi:hypothetical protein